MRSEGLSLNRQGRMWLVMARSDSIEMPVRQGIRFLIADASLRVAFLGSPDPLLHRLLLRGLGVTLQLKFTHLIKDKDGAGYNKTAID